MSTFTPEQRLKTTEQLCDLLRADDRLEGAVLVGSMGREPDRWSDIDLAAVVGGREDAGAVAGDWVDLMYRDFAAVHHYEVAFGETLVRGFLLEDLLEVDLAFSPLDSFAVWGPAEVVFDRGDTVRKASESPAPWEPPVPEWAGAAGLAWHDILHAGIAIRRGRVWQGLWYVERVRNRTLALSSQRRGWYADFLDYVDDLPTEELEPVKGALATSLDPGPLYAALRAATRSFVTELEKGEPALAAKLKQPPLTFVDAISRRVRHPRHNGSGSGV